MRRITNLTTQSSVHHGCRYHDILPDNYVKLKLFSPVNIIDILVTQAWHFTVKIKQIY